jgi:hypothetical protein
VLFRGGSVRSLGMFLCAKVYIDCIGVGVITVDGIAEVREGG